LESFTIRFPSGWEASFESPFTSVAQERRQEFQNLDTLFGFVSSKFLDGYASTFLCCSLISRRPYVEAALQIGIF
jgi:hypothetical protein